MNERMSRRRKREGKHFEPIWLPPHVRAELDAAIAWTVQAIQNQGRVRGSIRSSPVIHKGRKPGRRVVWHEP